ncbi:enoyl-CoA hydratase/isomerase family protein [Micromonospora sp. HUAS LYJ1]|uniref:enoyl-CoA hydratase/isomerase family protein n=1 Tax=Micromonospora sp. HUAS LYJ1 TaxID=3061626 RepID=UPI002671790D|nr:enoyl-CoA hydratase/isomerase family protein [Micromonospora sp. HUAS LYJ1]WKU03557.1 enoyl-CoA hydratase/isomerase family protein [Micromonospora sp. HUAS LYJ1]
MTDSVRYAVAGGLARITLNRPDVSNAVDLPTAYALEAAVTSAGTDDDVRAVLLTGAGQRFCAGGDLAAMAAAEEPAAYVRELALVLDRALRHLSTLPRPVVAAVHGAVAGAGLGVVLSADLVVAARSTKFVFAYPRVGLTPDCGVSVLLPRAIGQQRALQLALTPRPLGAEQARDWGLIAEVADDEAATPRAAAIAEKLAAGPTIAYGETKRLLRAGWGEPPERVSRDEADTIARLVAGSGAVDLITGFLGRS